MVTENLRERSYFGIGDLDVAPSAVYHMPLCEHPHLRLVGAESDEAESLRLAGFGVLLDLGHENFAESFEVFPQILLCRFPR